MAFWVLQTWMGQQHLLWRLCPHIKTMIHCIQKPIETWIFASFCIHCLVCLAFQRPQKRVPIGLFFWNQIHAWVISHVPMFHITQPLGIWSINVYNGYYSQNGTFTNPCSWVPIGPLKSRHAEWAECPMEAVQKLETWRLRLVIAGIDGMLGVNLGQSVRKALRMHTFGHLTKDLN